MFKRRDQRIETSDRQNGENIVYLADENYFKLTFDTFQIINLFLFSISLISELIFRRKEEIISKLFVRKIKFQLFLLIWEISFESTEKEVDKENE